MCQRCLTALPVNPHSARMRQNSPLLSDPDLCDKKAHVHPANGRIPCAMYSDVVHVRVLGVLFRLDPGRSKSSSFFLAVFLYL